MFGTGSVASNKNVLWKCRENEQGERNYEQILLNIFQSSVAFHI